MRKKVIFLLCVILAVLCLTACASGGGARRLAVEEVPLTDADIEVFPQLGHSANWEF